MKEETWEKARKTSKIKRWVKDKAYKMKFTLIDPIFQEIKETE